ncbi:hypothetical protein M2280_004444 [Prescottella agglutinans]|uniref:Uncharacterized protein n=1 Tax=Prescottella agglutinans TaxID=1644129 RepID=A0ABT6MFV1_9NOCA|nr:hypothetical protein [Prescottella agglutinans]
MPVPYPPADKLPVVMCGITGCPYRRRCQRGEHRHVCQQHGQMYEKYARFDFPLNLDSVELRYTPDGYPATS